jgi:hypothetical protein
MSMKHCAMMQKLQIQVGVWAALVKYIIFEKQNETEKHYFQVIQMTQVLQGSIGEY